MAPAPLFCANRKALLDEYAAAASEYLRMQSAQTQALAQGRSIVFEGELKAAQKRMEDARRSINLHERQHGCF